MTGLINNRSGSVRVGRLLLSAILLASLAVPAMAHHVLGRPSYSLNEDSNTPPSMNIETQIGDYLVTAMVYPAFPRPNEPGRINLYAVHLDTQQPLNTGVSFSVRDESWFKTDIEQLGAQVLDDNVYRQGFEFHNNGSYIITASFEAGGEPYQVDFPLRVGNPPPIGLVGGAVGLVVLVLLGVTLVQRRRLTSNKAAVARDDSLAQADLRQVREEHEAAAELDSAAHPTPPSPEP